MENPEDQPDRKNEEITGVLGVPRGDPITRDMAWSIECFSCANWRDEPRPGERPRLREALASAVAYSERRNAIKSAFS